MLSERQERLCTESRWDFSDLSALFLNCTLKRSPELSHTEGLIRLSQAILEKNGVGVELLRAASQQPGSARTMAGKEMWYRVWRRSGRRWPAGRGAVR